jgi:hypothetical protein
MKDLIALKLDSMRLGILDHVVFRVDEFLERLALGADSPVLKVILSNFRRDCWENFAGVVEGCVFGDTIRTAYDPAPDER